MVSMVEIYRLFIDGQWRDSSTGETIPAVNPFNQEVWASIPQASDQDVAGLQKAEAETRLPRRRVGAPAEIAKRHVAVGETSG